jgi:hypothetical protein
VTGLAQAESVIRRLIIEGLHASDFCPL